MEEKFKRWFVDDKDLEGLDSYKARDIIVKCFFEAQKETFSRSRQTLGLEVDEKKILSNIVAAIRLAFKEVGEDFDKPTRESLLKVVDVLARKAASWGTPKDIIDHHKEQIQMVLRVLR
ncbi:MAG: hypothetical protein ACK4Z9_04435 [Thermodesulfovibrionales bacterium]